MRARQLALAALRALLPSALLLLVDTGVALAVGVSAGNTNTPVATPSPTATQVLFIPQTPKATFTTVSMVITFTPTSTAAPASTFTPTATKTFTPQPTATSPASTSTPIPTDTPVPTATPTSVPATSTVPASSPTPPAPTSTPAPPASGVVINEVLSNPQAIRWDPGGTELVPSMQWFELHNVTDSAIDLTLWEVTSSAQSFSNRMPAGTSIPARGYLVFFEKDVGFNMGNATLSLLDPNNQLVDSVGVPNLPADQSYARIPDGLGGWQVDPSPTLGGANIFLAPTATPDLQATAAAIETMLAEPLPSPPAFDDDLPDATDLETGRKRTHARKGQPYQQLAISDIRGLPDDAPVATNGVVTLPTGLWDTSRAYIQDQAGILIHTYGEQQLQLGQDVSIRGRVHHFHGEVEIAAVKGGVQATAGGSMPDPRVAAPADVGPGLEALLVQVAGRVDALQRDYLSVVDDSASIRVFLYSKLGNRPDGFTSGQPITVTGVVNAFDPVGQGAAGEPATSHRLLPRSFDDIVLGGGDATRQASSKGRGERVASESQRDGSGRTIGPGLAFAGATPTEFATPVLSGRQTTGLFGLPSGGATLRLLGGGLPTAPAWLWPSLGVAVGVLAGGGISAAVWWRRVRLANGAEIPVTPAEPELDSLEIQAPEE